MASTLIGAFNMSSEIIYIAPKLNACHFNEAEVLGSVVWLWMQTPKFRDLPLHTLPALLLPVIKSRQFILAIENEQPVFYLSWAEFDEEAEHNYLTNLPITIKPEEWTSGDRTWILDVVAPFGHGNLTRELRSGLMSSMCMRSLYHRPGNNGAKLMQFRGKSVAPDVAQQWFLDRPIASFQF